MFSMFSNASSSTNDAQASVSSFKEQSSALTKFMKGDFNKSFGFMTSVRELAEIDNKINNMEGFILNKIKFVDALPPYTENTKLPESDQLRFYLALGLIDTKSSDNDLTNHAKMTNLGTAHFYKNTDMNEMRTYLTEYAAKLNDLKSITLETFELPENTGYQLELKNKLAKFLNKTKYFIFDIYLNHYVQYVYLLFAINVYKKTETFFKFNTEHQKQLALLSKTDELTNARSNMLESDKSNMEKLYANMNNLISQTTDVSDFNKPSDKDLKDLNEIIVQAGGNAEIKTAADELVQGILSKHVHFYELYKETRELMPAYFERINEMVVSKIEYLKELKTGIMKLEPKHVALFKETDGLLTKLMSSEGVSKGYKAEEKGMIQSTIQNKLKNITDNIDKTVSSNMLFAESMQKENESLVDTLSVNRPAAYGGFLRSGTRPPVGKCKRP